MVVDEYNYIVGIDFGTTFSAACYCLVNGENKPTVYTIKNWPRQLAPITTIPTMIAYHKATHQPIGIGGIPETPASYLVKDLPHLLNVNWKFNVSSVDMVADFLRIFNDHIIKRIKSDAKNPALRPIIRYCFTLQHPGEPFYLKNLVEAIKKAGIYTENDRDDKIVFIDSYTAMAKFFLRTKKGLNLRDKFLVCDADQYYLTIKTMDIISIGRDTDVKEEEPVDESLLDMQDLGGNKIDALFKTYITDVMKNEEEYKEADEQELDSAIEILVQNFVKNIKYKDFGSKKEIYITKPLIHSIKSQNPYLTLSTDDLKSKVYDPIIDKICNQVQIAINKHSRQLPKKLFLFGKLSNSEYLVERLTKIKDENGIKEEIDLVQEKDVSAAQGTVYHGLYAPLSIERVTPIHDNINQIVNKEDTSYYDFNYKQYTHVIGIDFGTSFSKWYYQSSPPVEQAVKFDKTIMQIPTLSLYDQRLQEQKLWGTEAYKNYYSVENSGKLLTRFKLLLNELNYEGFDELTSLKAIASYLRALHGLILENMKIICGEQKTKFRYCLTVPTIWSDKTKKSMRSAAVLAGIINPRDHPCRLMLVNEPEAAAMFYSTDTLAIEEFSKQSFGKKKRIRVLVCDAGGGTVDLATYELFKQGKQTDYSIDEVTTSSGDICGSSFLDDKFRQLISKKCYNLDYILEDHVLEQMVNQFATEIKDKFMDNHQGNIEISLPVNAKPMKSKLEVTPNELSSEVFEPVIGQVMKLINDQFKISSAAKKDKNDILDVIILTGGLGQSRYLKKKVEKKYSSIFVYQPELYDQSVVRGAVALALNPNMITQRFTRKSYGVEVLLPFNNVTDPAMNQVKTKKDKKEYTKFKYDNFVETNSSVKTYEYYEKTYYVEYPNNTYAAIYCSDYQKDDKIFNVLDPRVELVFKFNVDMPQDTGRKDGDMVPITIRMFLGQTEIKIDTILEGETTRQSFSFNPISPEHRKEVEEAHAFNEPRRELIRTDTSKTERSITEKVLTLFGKKSK